MKIRFYLIIFVILLLSTGRSHATHIRAGNILTQRISALTFRFTLYVYTNTGSDIHDDQADFNFGDGTSATAPLFSRTNIGSNTEENIYVIEHTFPAPGFYHVGYTEYNRTGSILNMSNSVSTPFFIETTVVAGGTMAMVNESPTLLNPPLDKAQAEQLFVYNPGAFDKEGDSISYKMVVPMQDKINTVSGYYTPQAMTLDAYTGDLVWDTPKVPGLYNIAFIIEEWRNGIRFGYITRDMQIEVLPPSPNKPPVLEKNKDTCIVAGKTIHETIKAYDPNAGDLVTLTSNNNPAQGVYQLGATFSDPTPANPVQGEFDWSTNCGHVRSQPYSVVFKAADNPKAPSPILVDYHTFNITVLGPAPVLESLSDNGKGLTLTWRPYDCPNASSILIYRKDCDSSDFKPTDCEAGVPEFLGFTQIAEVPANNTSYADDQGIKLGSFYCYMIVAKFPFPGNGSSYASNEICGGIDIEKPLMASVSVNNTHEGNGAITVSWLTPQKITDAGPYQYNLFRANGLKGTDFTFIGSTFTLNDTVFTDTPLNTTLDYNYRIEFISGSGNKGINEEASDIGLRVTPGDKEMKLNWSINVPWKIVYNKIYRSQNGGQFLLLDSIGTDSFYVDRNVMNCDTFCYYIESFGEYCQQNVSSMLKSTSRVNCGVPFNSEMPNAPVLFLPPLDCNKPDLLYNALNWMLQSKECEIIKEYKIYYAPYEEDEAVYYTSVSDTFYLHKALNNIPISGCYEVSAVNGFNIEGPKSNRVCIDICVDYALPNLITPNGDGLNDVYIPLKEPPVRNVEHVEFTVFNRWGSRVHFQDNDIFLNWKGEALADGIYYYNADVKFYKRLRKKDEKIQLKGWVQIMSNQDKRHD